MRFDEKSYEELMRRLVSNFEIINFHTDFRPGKKQAVLRHDVDFSPNRALRLAQIENKEGVQATYYVQLASRFYNCFEPEIVGIFKNISKLGHEIGLHFDCEVISSVSKQDYLERIRFEREVLETLLDLQVRSFCLHNPTMVSGIEIDDAVEADMVNAGSSVYREKFKYCSDSNGHWRFESVWDLVADSRVDKLHVNLHPIWWQEHEVPPREAVENCLLGRARNGGAFYDDSLLKGERKNIRVLE